MKYGLSTTSLHRLGLEEKFQVTKELGFDGIEIMISHAREAHSYERLKHLSDQYELPILSIHAPTLLAYHFVWGVKPYPKLERAAEHAAEVGAETVVVHPPFRWQKDYSEDFLVAVQAVNETHGVHIAVENMYPWYIAGKEVRAYGVEWDETKNTVDSLTFDFSHANVAGVDIVSETREILPNLRHIHLSDAEVGGRHDAHLPPGKGNLPLKAAFKVLKDNQWGGNVVAEVNTILVHTQDKRQQLLKEVLQRGRELMS